MSVNATAKYHDSDARALMAALDLAGDPMVISHSTMTLEVSDSGCDGIIWLMLNGQITLCLDPDEARRLGRELIDAADHEDAKIDDDDEGDDA